MASADSEADSDGKHVAFQMAYIWTALAVALGAGFSIGAHLTFIMGFGFPLGKGFASFVQTHGHVQLIGWAGLFIMGISLHFIPRLAGLPIPYPERLRHIVWLMGLGLTLRSIGHAVLPYLIETPLFVPVLWLVVVSGGLEWVGVLLYTYTLLRVFRAKRRHTIRPAMLAVRPYFAMMVVGWLLYAALNLAMLAQMAVGRFVVVHSTWNAIAVQSFVGLVLLPVAFAFSVRMFPLYLRLVVPDRSVSGVAYAYLFALILQVLPNVPPLTRAWPQLMPEVSALGTLLKGGVILWFVWKLSVLTRLRPPWTVHRQLHPGPERRPSRPGLPDYGEFGRFERLVYAAYIWLVLAALADIVMGISGLLHLPSYMSPQVTLHMYGLGFITLLILGMAVRMLPGFLRKRRIASPVLVEATFWLGNGAVLSRLLLFVLPAGFLQAIPGALTGARIAFALSGFLGLASIFLLATNLWRTAADLTTP